MTSRLSSITSPEFNKRTGTVPFGDNSSMEGGLSLKRTSRNSTCCPLTETAILARIA